MYVQASTCASLTLAGHLSSLAMMPTTLGKTNKAASHFKNANCICQVAVHVFKQNMHTSPEGHVVVLNLHSFDSTSSLFMNSHKISIQVES